MIVFVRVPKTASQTLAQIARQNYPRKRSTGLPNMFTDVERCRERLRRAAREHGAIDLLYGHVAVDPGAPFPPGARYFTMLREPVKRSISHYHAYMRRQVRNGRQPSEVTIDRMIAESPLEVPDNMQTRQLSGRAVLDDPPFGECSSTMLEEAKHNLDQHFDVVGLTERFDESVVLLGETYGWQDLSYTPVNIWDSPAATDLPSGTVRRIREENSLDLDLYDFVQERFARLVAAQGSDFAVNVEALQRSRAMSEGTVPPANGDLRSQLVDARAQLLLARREIAEAGRSRPDQRAPKTARRRAKKRAARG